MNKRAIALFVIVLFLNITLVSALPFWLDWIYKLPSITGKQVFQQQNCPSGYSIFKDNNQLIYSANCQTTDSGVIGNLYLGNPPQLYTPKGFIQAGIVDLACTSETDQVTETICGPFVGNSEMGEPLSLVCQKSITCETIQQPPTTDQPTQPCPGLECPAGTTPNLITCACESTTITPPITEKSCQDYDWDYSFVDELQAGHNPGQKNTMVYAWSIDAEREGKNFPLTFELTGPEGTNTGSAESGMTASVTVPVSDSLQTFSLKIKSGGVLCHQALELKVLPGCGNQLKEETEACDLSTGQDVCTEKTFCTNSCECTPTKACPIEGTQPPCISQGQTINIPNAPDDRYTTTCDNNCQYKYCYQKFDDQNRVVTVGKTIDGDEKTKTDGEKNPETGKITCYTCSQDTLGDFQQITCPIIEVACNNNNIAQSGEECDGTDLKGKTCKSSIDSTTSQFFDGGTLKCDTKCNYDTSDCYVCGDGVVEGPESCEDVNNDSIADDPSTCQKIEGFLLYTKFYCGVQSRSELRCQCIPPIIETTKESCEDADPSTSITKNGLFVSYTDGIKPKTEEAFNPALIEAIGTLKDKLKSEEVALNLLTDFSNICFSCNKPGEKLGDAQTGDDVGRKVRAYYCEPIEEVSLKTTCEQTSQGVFFRQLQNEQIKEEEWYPNRAKPVTKEKDNKKFSPPAPFSDERYASLLKVPVSELASVDPDKKCWTCGMPDASYILFGGKISTSSSQGQVSSVPVRVDCPIVEKAERKCCAKKDDKGKLVDGKWKVISSPPYQCQENLVEDTTGDACEITEIPKKQVCCKIPDHLVPPGESPFKPQEAYSPPLPPCGDLEGPFPEQYCEPTKACQPCPNCDKVVGALPQPGLSESLYLQDPKGITGKDEEQRQPRCGDGLINGKEHFDPGQAVVNARKEVERQAGIQTICPTEGPGGSLVSNQWDDHCKKMSLGTRFNLNSCQCEGLAQIPKTGQVMDTSCKIYETTESKIILEPINIESEVISLVQQQTIETPPERTSKLLQEYSLSTDGRLTRTGENTILSVTTKEDLSKITGQFSLITGRVTEETPKIINQVKNSDGSMTLEYSNGEKRIIVSTFKKNSLGEIVEEQFISAIITKDDKRIDRRQLNSGELEESYPDGTVLRYKILDDETSQITYQKFVNDKKETTEIRYEYLSDGTRKRTTSASGGFAIQESLINPNGQQNWRTKEETDPFKRKFLYEYQKTTINGEEKEITIIKNEEGFIVESKIQKDNQELRVDCETKQNKFSCELPKEEQYLREDLSDGLLKFTKKVSEGEKKHEYTCKLTYTKALSKPECLMNYEERELDEGIIKKSNYKYLGDGTYKIEDLDDSRDVTIIKYEEEEYITETGEKSMRTVPKTLMATSITKDGALSYYLKDQPDETQTREFSDGTKRLLSVPKCPEEKQICDDSEKTRQTVSMTNEFGDETFLLGKDKFGREQYKQVSSDGKTISYYNEDGTDNEGKQKYFTSKIELETEDGKQTIIREKIQDGLIKETRNNPDNSQTILFFKEGASEPEKYQRIDECGIDSGIIETQKEPEKPKTFRQPCKEETEILTKSISFNKLTDKEKGDFCEAKIKAQKGIDGLTAQQAGKDICTFELDEDNYRIKEIEKKDGSKEVYTYPDYEGETLTRINYVGGKQDGGYVIIANVEEIKDENGNTINNAYGEPKKYQQVLESKYLLDDGTAKIICTARLEDNSKLQVEKGRGAVSKYISLSKETKETLASLGFIDEKEDTFTTATQTVSSEGTKTFSLEPLQNGNLLMSVSNEDLRNSNFAHPIYKKHFEECTGIEPNKKIEEPEEEPNQQLTTRRSGQSSLGLQGIEQSLLSQGPQKGPVDLGTALGRQSPAVCVANALNSLGEEEPLKPELVYQVIKPVKDGEDLVLRQAFNINGQEEVTDFVYPAKKSSEKTGFIQVNTKEKTWAEYDENNQAVQLLSKTQAGYQLTTYSDFGGLAANCKDTTQEKYQNPLANKIALSPANYCKEQPELCLSESCPDNYDPVCGKKGQTYKNECVARAEKAEINSKGECSCEDLAKLKPGTEIKCQKDIIVICETDQDCNKSTSTCSNGEEYYKKLCTRKENSEIKICAPNPELATICLTLECLPVRANYNCPQTHLPKEIYDKNGCFAGTQCISPSEPTIIPEAQSCPLVSTPTPVTGYKIIPKFDDAGCYTNADMIGNEEITGMAAQELAELKNIDLPFKEEQKTAEELLAEEQPGEFELDKSQEKELKEKQEEDCNQVSVCSDGTVYKPFVKQGETCIQNPLASCKSPLTTHQTKIVTSCNDKDADLRCDQNNDNNEDAIIITKTEELIQIVEINFGSKDNDQDNDGIPNWLDIDPYNTGVAFKKPTYPLDKASEDKDNDKNKDIAELLISSQLFEVGEGYNFDQDKNNDLTTDKTENSFKSISHALTSFAELIPGYLIVKTPFIISTNLKLTPTTITGRFYKVITGFLALDPGQPGGVSPGGGSKIVGGIPLEDIGHSPQPYDYVVNVYDNFNLKQENFKAFKKYQTEVVDKIIGSLNLDLQCSDPAYKAFLEQQKDNLIKNIMNLIEQVKDSLKKSEEFIDGDLDIAYSKLLEVDPVKNIINKLNNFPEDYAKAKQEFKQAKKQNAQIKQKFRELNENLENELGKTHGGQEFINAYNQQKLEEAGINTDLEGAATKIKEAQNNYNRANERMIAYNSAKTEEEKQAILKQAGVKSGNEIVDALNVRRGMLNSAERSYATVQRNAEGKSSQANQRNMQNAFDKLPDDLKEKFGGSFQEMMDASAQELKSTLNLMNSQNFGNFWFGSTKFKPELIDSEDLLGGDFEGTVKERMNNLVDAEITSRLQGKGLPDTPENRASLRREVENGVWYRGLMNGVIEAGGIKDKIRANEQLTQQFNDAVSAELKKSGFPDTPANRRAAERKLMENEETGPKWKQAFDQTKLTDDEQKFAENIAEEANKKTKEEIEKKRQEIFDKRKEEFKKAQEKLEKIQNFDFETKAQDMYGQIYDLIQEVDSIILGLEDLRKQAEDIMNYDAPCPIDNKAVMQQILNELDSIIDMLESEKENMNKFIDEQIEGKAKDATTEPTERIEQFSGEALRVQNEKMQQYKNNAQDPQNSAQQQEKWQETANRQKAAFSTIYFRLAADKMIVDALFEKIQALQINALIYPLLILQQKTECCVQSYEPVKGTFAPKEEPPEEEKPGEKKEPPKGPETGQRVTGALAITIDATQCAPQIKSTFGFSSITGNVVLAMPKQIECPYCACNQVIVKGAFKEGTAPQTSFGPGYDDPLEPKQPPAGPDSAAHGAQQRPPTTQLLADIGSIIEGGTIQPTIGAIPLSPRLVKVDFEQPKIINPCAEKFNLEPVQIENAFSLPEETKEAVQNQATCWNDFSNDYRSEQGRTKWREQANQAINNELKDTGISIEGIGNEDMSSGIKIFYGGVEVNPNKEGDIPGTFHNVQKIKESRQKQIEERFQAETEKIRDCHSQTERAAQVTSDSLGAGYESYAAKQDDGTYKVQIKAPDGTIGTPDNSGKMIFHTDKGPAVKIGDKYVPLNEPHEGKIYTLDENGNLQAFNVGDKTKEDMDKMKGCFQIHAAEINQEREFQDLLDKEDYDKAIRAKIEQGIMQANRHLMFKDFEQGINSLMEALKAIAQVLKDQGLISDDLFDMIDELNSDNLGNLKTALNQLYDVLKDNKEYSWLFDPEVGVFEKFIDEFDNLLKNKNLEEASQILDEQKALGQKGLCTEQKTPDCASKEEYERLVQRLDALMNEDKFLKEDQKIALTSGEEVSYQDFIKTSMKMLLMGTQESPGLIDAMKKEVLGTISEEDLASVIKDPAKLQRIYSELGKLYGEIIQKYGGILGDEIVSGLINFKDHYSQESQYAGIRSERQSEYIALKTEVDLSTGERTYTSINSQRREELLNRGDNVIARVEANIGRQTAHSLLREVLSEWVRGYKEEGLSAYHSKLEDVRRIIEKTVGDPKEKDRLISIVNDLQGHLLTGTEAELTSKLNEVMDSLAEIINLPENRVSDEEIRILGAVTELASFGIDTQLTDIKGTILSANTEGISNDIKARERLSEQIQVYKAVLNNRFDEAVDNRDTEAQLEIGRAMSNAVFMQNTNNQQISILKLEQQMYEAQTGKDTTEVKQQKVQQLARDLSEQTTQRDATFDMRFMNAEERRVYTANLAKSGVDHVGEQTDLAREAKEARGGSVWGFLSGVSDIGANLLSWTGLTDHREEWTTTTLDNKRKDTDLEKQIGLGRMTAAGTLMQQNDPAGYETFKIKLEVGAFNAPKAAGHMQNYNSERAEDYRQNGQEYLSVLTKLETQRAGNQAVNEATKKAASENRRLTKAQIETAYNLGATQALSEIATNVDLEMRSTAQSNAYNVKDSVATLSQRYQQVLQSYTAQYASELDRLSSGGLTVNDDLLKIQQNLGQTLNSLAGLGQTHREAFMGTFTWGKRSIIGTNLRYYFGSGYDESRINGEEKYNLGNFQEAIQRATEGKASEAEIQMLNNLGMNYKKGGIFLNGFSVDRVGHEIIQSQGISNIQNYDLNPISQMLSIRELPVQVAGFFVGGQAVKFVGSLTKTWQAANAARYIRTAEKLNRYLKYGEGLEDLTILQRVAFRTSQAAISTTKFGLEATAFDVGMRVASDTVGAAITTLEEFGGAPEGRSLTPMMDEFFHNPGQSILNSAGMLGTFKVLGIGGRETQKFADSISVRSELIRRYGPEVAQQMLPGVMQRVQAGEAVSSFLKGAQRLETSLSMTKAIPVAFEVAGMALHEKLEGLYSGHSAPWYETIFRAGFTTAMMRGVSQINHKENNVGVKATEVLKDVSQSRTARDAVYERVQNLAGVEPSARKPFESSQTGREYLDPLKQYSPKELTQLSSQQFRQHQELLNEAIKHEQQRNNEAAKQARQQAEAMRSRAEATRDLASEMRTLENKGELRTPEKIPEKPLVTPREQLADDAINNPQRVTEQRILVEGLARTPSEAKTLLNRLLKEGSRARLTNNEYQLAKADNNLANTRYKLEQEAQRLETAYREGKLTVADNSRLLGLQRDYYSKEAQFYKEAARDKTGTQRAHLEIKAREAEQKAESTKVDLEFLNKANQVLPISTKRDEDEDKLSLKAREAIENSLQFLEAQILQKGRVLTINTAALKQMSESTRAKLNEGKAKLQAEEGAEQLSQKAKQLRKEAEEFRRKATNEEGKITDIELSRKAMEANERAAQLEKMARMERSVESLEQERARLEQRRQELESEMQACA